MSDLNPAIAHLLRRAGFGVNAADAESWNQYGVVGSVNRLIDYEFIADDVDDLIGASGYLGTISEGDFDPDNQISDARQRWLFRLVHTKRPLQEKMTLFWHNHFATGFNKITGQLGGAEQATRALAAKPTLDTAEPTFFSQRGQIELFRDFALGNFRDLLLAVSEGPAMVAWLDGDSNFRRNPQENFARELMELFTMGVGVFTESDVHEAARVFTGWNLHLGGAFPRFWFNKFQHDVDAKTFSFSIYPNGDRTIPSRSRNEGKQDGIDFIDAVARHPETGPRLVRKLYAFFVNEFDPPNAALVDQLSATYYATDCDMRAVVGQLLRSNVFHDPANYWTRYSWPVEFVVRLIREVGWTGFSARAAMTPLANMGQTLFEPPDVSGWSLGSSWISTGRMLARMNFAAQLAENQRIALRDAALGSAVTPDAFLNYFLDQLALLDLSRDVRATLLEYLEVDQGWVGSKSQVTRKASGLVHLLGASSEYQFV